MNLSHRIRRIGALACALLQLGASVVLAADACTTTSSSTGLGAVFSTYTGGAVSIGNPADVGGQCNVEFYGGSVVNTEPGAFGANGSGTPGNYCKNHSASPAEKVASSGKTVAHVTLDTYSASAAAFDVKLANADQFYYGNTAQLMANYSLTTTTTVSGDGRSLTLPAKGGEVQLPAGDYDTVTVDFSNAKLKFLGDSKIKRLELRCNGGMVTFAPGKYFIDTVDWAAGCSIAVDGSSGTAVLNVANGFQINGGTTCANYSPCADQSAMASQKPERLQINVYSGNLTTQGNVHIAAGLVVDQGSFDMGNGTPLTLVGEVLATRVTAQNNAGTKLYAKASSIPTGSTTPMAQMSDSGYYSLTPPAVPPLANVGDLAFIASQRDVKADGTAGISGHLFAYALQADGSVAASATWDAAAEYAKLTVAQRQARIYTVNAAGNALVSLDSADAAAFGTSSAERVVNPNAESGKYLAGRAADSVLGRPWRTAPIIVGDSVLFATDDGVLYSVSRSSGALQWGWIPRQVLPLTADAKTLMDTHPWGQIAAVASGGSTYLTGSVLGGEIHFALSISNSGATLNSVAWLDQRTGYKSPSYPFGGAAPTVAVSGAATPPTVAYVVGNQLISRTVDGSGSAKVAALSKTVSSNLLYYRDGEIYFGDSSGHLQVTDLDGVLGTSPGDSGSGEAIQSLNGALINTAGGNALLLLAQSKSRLAAFKRYGGSWSLAWYTGAGVSSDTGVPALDSDLTITGPATIVNSLVYLPVTRDATPASATCVPYLKYKTGYAFGPLQLADGTSGTAGIKFRGATIGTSLLHELGAGEAQAVVTTRIKGTGNARHFAISFANAGDASPSAGWGQLEFSRPGVTSRLNWRELTNFF